MINDIVWQAESKLNSSLVKVIFVEGRLKNDFTNKFSVNSTQPSPHFIKSSLTIYNINAIDATYVYKCACNIYSACINDKSVSVETTFTYLTTTKTSNKNE